MPYVRTVKATSGATAVQIVYSSHRGSRDIEHIGSAHYDAELEVLKAVARQRLAAGQGVLDLGPGFGGRASAGPLPITSSRMGHLLNALACGYDSAHPPGHQPVDRRPDRLVNQEIRPDRPPPLHHRDPGR